MLVRKKDGREGKRKAGMKEAKVDGVLGRSGRKEKESKGCKGGNVQENASGVQGVCNSELR